MSDNVSQVEVLDKDLFGAARLNILCPFLERHMTEFRCLWAFEYLLSRI